MTYPDTSLRNPVSVALRIIEEYRRKAVQSLVLGGLSPDMSEEVVRRMRSGTGPGGEVFDQGVWFTLRQPYAQSTTTLEHLCDELDLHPSLIDAFCHLKPPYAHQEEAIRSILAPSHTVVATGTGSGKTEAFFLPILQLCLRDPRPGVKAIIIYPRNALVSDQVSRLRKYTDHVPGISVAEYVGETKPEDRKRLQATPPDILVTNYVMLERILTLSQTTSLQGRGTLKAIVLDEVHTYTGNLGADVAWLIARLRATSGTNPICVGASATLRKHGGYLPEDGLMEFLSDLFALSEGERVTLIEPTYADVPMEGGNFPIPRWDTLEWTDDLSKRGSLCSSLFAIHEDEGTWNLLGDKSGPIPLVDRLPTLLQEHALVRAWRAFLAGKAKTYSELVSFTGKTYERSTGMPCQDATMLTNALLAAINFSNFASADSGSGSRVLDLVTHVILRNVNGTLKRCLVCGRYHLGSESECLDCGITMFEVWREDIDQVVAAIDPCGPTLKPALDSPSTTHSAFVTIRHRARDEEVGTGLAFNVGQDSLEPGGLTIDVTDDGYFVARRLPIGAGSSVASQVVCGIDTTHNLQYLIALCSLLLQESGVSPRLLVFSDSRQGAAIAGYVLSEHFANRYLLHRAHEDSPGVALPLPEVHHRLRAALSHSAGRVMRKLADSVDLWFVRLCATPPRLYPEHQGVLSFASKDTYDALSEEEQFLVRVCLAEGAIAWNSIVVPPSHEDRELFEYDHVLRTQRRLITLAASTRAAKGTQVITLSSRGMIYRSELGGYEGDAIAGALGSLLSKGILVTQEADPEGNARYALAPEVVALAALSDDQSSSLDTEYRAVGIHSSETPKELRRNLEMEFDDPSSGLCVLAATSTLEMGVDFDMLTHVLCNGVPPSPASYAQRAGRAGRSRRSWYGLVVTWCDDRNDHDMFFFQNKEEVRTLLSGEVAVPRMDRTNRLVVRRHLFSAAVQGCVDNLDDLKGVCGDVRAAIKRIPSELRRQFRETIGAEQGRVAIDELRDRLGQLISRTGGSYTSRLYFDDSLSPSYGFRRDDVSLEQDYGSDKDRVVSTNPPEKAIRSWFPGQVVATARGLMILREGIEMSRVRLPNSSSTLTSYRKFIVDRESGYQSISTRRTYGRAEAHVESLSLQEDSISTSQGWITSEYLPEARVVMVNRGPAVPRLDSSGQGKSGASEPWACEIVCDGLLLTCDDCLVDEKHFASLVCAVDHYMHERYRLSDSDVLLIGGFSSSRIPQGHRGLLFADSAGHGLIGFAEMAEHLDTLLIKAHERLLNCACQDGCFRCLRTLSSRDYLRWASKAAAIAMIAPIIGRGKFCVSVPSAAPADNPVSGEHLIRITKSGTNVQWSGVRGRGMLLIDEDEKSVLADALEEATAGIPSGVSVDLACNVSYVVRTMNGEKTGRLDESDRRLIMLGARYRFRNRVEES